MTDRFRRRDCLLIALCLAWFLYWAAPMALEARFAADDPMNLFFSLKSGYLGLSKGVILFFTTEYRPLGGLFYLTIYKAFGLNPLPFRIVLLLILCVNVALFYEWSRTVTNHRLTALLAGLIGAFHVRLISIYYATAFAYDILCYAFLFAAFLVHMKRGDRGIWLTAALSIAALTSKEMAIVLAPLLASYELGKRQARCWRPVMLIAVITAVYCLGRTFLPGALSEQAGYRMVWSLPGMMALQARYIETLFLLPHQMLGGWHVVAIWGVIALLAIRLLALRMCLAWLILSPIPILLVAREGGPTLYIPYAGYALLTAALVLWPLRRYPLLQWMVVLTVCVALSGRWKRELPWHWNHVRKEQDKTWRVLQAFATSAPAIAAGDSILLLNDPFPDYDTTFLAALHYRDPRLSIVTHKTGHPLPPPAGQADYRHVWLLDGTSIKRLR